MEITVQHEDHERDGRFFAQLDADNQAEMTYQKVNSKLRICDHTGVPTAFEGQGIAFQLLQALIKDARQQGIKYVPLCPYVAYQYRKHPEWADVFDVQ